MVTASQLVDLCDLEDSPSDFAPSKFQKPNANKREIIVIDDDEPEPIKNEKTISKSTVQKQEIEPKEEDILEALFPPDDVSHDLKDESGSKSNEEKKGAFVGDGTSESPMVLTDSPMEDSVIQEICKMEARSKKRKLPAFITDPKKKFSRNNPYSDALRKKRKLEQAKKDELCKKNLEAVGRKQLPLPNQRVIVFDTETTGFGKDDCIIEIGAVEMMDGEISGVQFHSYVNATRTSHREAVKVHGLDAKFLSRHRLIDPVMKSFMNFIDDETILVAHNAAFDLRMLNQELKRLNSEELKEDRIFDTQAYLRLRFPSRSYNLNAVCEYYHIDTSHRTIHGALLDAQLTARLLQKLWKLEAHELRARNTNRFFMKKLGK